MTSGEAGAERGRPTWMTVAWLGAPAVAVILFAVGWLLYGSTSAAGERTGGARGFSCVVVTSADQPEDDSCEKVASEFARRSTLDDDERHQTEQTRSAVQYLLADAEMDCRRRPATCSATGPPQLTVDEVRQALKTGGHQGAVVRTARADDPAPAGSIFYAVPTGPGCVLGHLGDGGGPNGIVLGTLPDGTCSGR